MTDRNPKFIQAFVYAFHGWRRGLTERSFKIDLIAAIFVLTAALFFRLSLSEWLIVIFLIGAVISAELTNTAIEEICDLITARLKLHYSDTTAPRDLAAGASLAMAVVAALIGLIIFIPKVLTLLL